jgi:hypothetical protein
VQESVTKPHLWLITEQGLTLLFPPYSFGAPYVMGGTEVSIPWADLRQYLNPARTGADPAQRLSLRAFRKAGQMSRCREAKRCAISVG